MPPASCAREHELALSVADGRGTRNHGIDAKRRKKRRRKQYKRLLDKEGSRSRPDMNEMKRWLSRLIKREIRPSHVIFDAKELGISESSMLPGARNRADLCLVAKHSPQDHPKKGIVPSAESNSTTHPHAEDQVQWGDAAHLSGGSGADTNCQRCNLVFLLRRFCRLDWNLDPPPPPLLVALSQTHSCLAAVAGQQ